MNTPHPYWLVGASLGLALIPIMIGLFTSFVKVQVILSFFRSGLGAQQVPSGLVILGLSVAITFSIMSPTINEFQAGFDTISWEKIQRNPQKIKKEEIDRLLKPWYDFLLLHSGERERIALSDALAGEEVVAEAIEEDLQPEGEVIPWKVLLPAFIVTELKEAFLIGFIILVPFLVIDLVVANILAGIGMFMVSPVMISLPIKIALFALADGWLLLVTGLTQSYL